MRVGFDNEFDNLKVVDIVRDEETAKIPTRGTSKSAGYDLCANIDVDEVAIAPHTTMKIGTGIRVAIPDNHFGGIFARSGLATKKGLRPANAVGIIDADYTGEIIVALYNDSDEYQTIKNGERIAQLVIIPFVGVIFNEVEKLDSTGRGDGGFGSTGTV